jgi:diguanylate cyclase (GGDEF)-like protein
MMVARRPIAVLGVPAAELTSRTARRRIGDAAALVAIAIKNAELYRQTQEKGIRDPLTGCFNRGYMAEAIQNELRRARRNSSPLSVLLFDLDRFKEINDRYGHQAGDRTLVGVAQQLHGTLRSSDVKCRYGGDEFLVILPETDQAGARLVAESVRQAVERLDLTFENEPTRVTATIGVATSSADATDVGDVAGLLARADASLYEAKRAGRNQVGPHITD